MAGYRDPKNYGFSYQKDVDSIEGINNRLTKVEEDGGGGTTDYNKLENKPTLNNEVIEGEKTSDDYHISGSGSKPEVEGETLVFK